MELPEQRLAELAAAQEVIEGALAAHRQLTHDETLQIERHVASVRVIDERLASASNGDSIPSQSPTMGSHATAAAALPT